MTGAKRSPLAIGDCAREHLRLDRLRRDHDVVVVPPPARDEAPGVLAVGHDRVGVAEDAPGQGQHGGVGQRARLGPDRGPQHERAPVAPRPEVGGGQHRAAGEGRNDRLVVAGHREGGPSAGIEPRRWKRGAGQLGVQVREPRRRVPLAAAATQHFDAVALGEQLEQRQAIVRQVGGQECNGHPRHVSRGGSEPVTAASRTPTQTRSSGPSSRGASGLHPRPERGPAGRTACAGSAMSPAQANAAAIVPAAPWWQR